MDGQFLWLIIVTVVMVLMITGIIGIVSFLMLIRKQEKITFILTEDGAEAPQRGTSKSAGYDLKSIEKCLIPSRSFKAISTGIKVQLPQNTYGRIASRSGLSINNGLEVGAGVVDEDFKDQIKVIIHNHSDTDFSVEVGDRIAQLIIERVVYPTTFIQDIKGSTTTLVEFIREIRGVGGFGSTGL